MKNYLPTETGVKWAFLRRYQRSTCKWNKAGGNLGQLSLKYTLWAGMVHEGCAVHNHPQGTGWVRWPLQSHSSPVICWEDKHTGRCKSYLKSVTWGPPWGPTNNLDFVWLWEKVQWVTADCWCSAHGKERQRNGVHGASAKWGGRISILPTWAARCSEKWAVFSVAAISERIKPCSDVSYKEILLDMAVQNIGGD